MKFRSNLCVVGAWLGSIDMDMDIEKKVVADLFQASFGVMGVTGGRRLHKSQVSRANGTYHTHQIFEDKERSIWDT